jgi:hypothetical protein
MISEQETVIITFTVIIGILCLFIGFHCMKLFCRIPEQEIKESEFVEEDPQMIQVIVKQSPLHVIREEDPVAPV